MVLSSSTWGATQVDGFVETPTAGFSTWTQKTGRIPRNSMVFLTTCRRRQYDKAEPESGQGNLSYV